MGGDTESAYQSSSQHPTRNTMVKLLLVVALAALTAVLAEPPVGRQYLPPSSRYGAPGRSSGRFTGRSSLASRLGGSRGFPSSRYGVPGRSSAGPSSVYGAPGAFGRFSGAPSSQYGAPFAGGSGFSGAPSSQYGAPFAGGSGFGGAPSTQYGAPFGGNGLGAFSAPSTEYGAPSGAYRGFGGSPSAVYGAPGASGNYADGGFNGYSGGRYSGTTEDPLAEPANYEFSYEVSDAQSGSEFGHQENRQDESAQGEYRVLLPDGRTQVVEYEADLEGYKPNIRYEEPTGPYAASLRQGNGFGSGGPY